ncbi:Uncharacterised protein [Vibrio cholerae]|nr:Uncharacterised protein [Vibrio cholerae]
MPVMPIHLNSFTVKLAKSGSLKRLKFLLAYIKKWRTVNGLQVAKVKQWLLKSVVKVKAILKMG